MPLGLWLPGNPAEMTGLREVFAQSLVGHMECVVQHLFAICPSTGTAADGLYDHLPKVKRRSSVVSSIVVVFLIWFKGLTVASGESMQDVELFLTLQGHTNHL